MPYDKFREGERVCIYKVDEAGDKVGDTLGCHASDKEADGQLAALYANEPGAAEKATWSVAKVNNLPDSSFLYVEPSGTTKDETGRTLPRSKRHFPIKDENGKIDLSHLRNAIARIPQSNAPGLSAAKKRSLQDEARKMLANANKDTGETETKCLMEMGVPWSATSFAQLDELETAREVADDVSELTSQFSALASNIMAAPDLTDKTAALSTLADEFKARLTQATQEPAAEEKEAPHTTWLQAVKDAVREAFGATKTVPEPEPAPTHTLPGDLMLWKEGERYRWLATFSNRYRDHDFPPEILSDAAHREFATAIDRKEWPMPELWHWHLPGTRWGVADWMAYDGAFMLASGLVDKGHEGEAERLAAMADVKTSHGMPVKEIVRDSSDPTVITRYRTLEISDLPGWAAANPLTGFNILKEVSDMSIPEDKRKYLREVGLSDDQIAAIENAAAAKAKEAESAGLETKAAPVVETAPTSTPDQPPAAPAAPALTAQEVADAIALAVKPLMDRLDAVAGEVKALKATDEEKVAAKAAATPAASLRDLVSRAIGAPEARVDGRSALAKAGPPEEPTTSDKVTYTSIPWIDTMVSQSHQKPQ